MLWALISSDCQIKNKLNVNTIPIKNVFFISKNKVAIYMDKGTTNVPVIIENHLPLSSIYPNIIKTYFKIKI